MHVARLRITGFRGIREAEIILQPHTVLVGPNNVGKTAVVEALALLLGRKRQVRKLSEYDFFGGDPGPADRVHIRGVITGFTRDEPEKNPMFGVHGASVMWWNETAQELETTPDNGGTLAMEIGYCARFDVAELDPEVIRYFVDGDVDPFLDDAVEKIPSALITELGMYLLPAKRTWEYILSFRSDLFRQVLTAVAALPGQKVKGLRDALRSPADRPEEQEPFASLIGRLEAELSHYFGSEGSHISFRPTAGDTPSVLDSLQPHLPGKADVPIPVGRHGSGLISLQRLLLLLEFGRRRGEEGSNFILIAEEPELHLHPGHHRRLVARVRGVTQQSIITTHSPEVAAFHLPSEILALSCDRSGTLRASPLTPKAAPPPEENKFLRLFVLHRAEVCEALMSEVVVVPEGVTEFRWMRLLAKESATAEGWQFAEGNAELHLPPGILPTHDASVVETYAYLCRSIPSLLPLVDGDGQGDSYVEKLSEPVGFEAPPNIVQLASGRELEDVLAWILRGDSTTAGTAALEKVLEPGFDAPTLDALLKNEWKTRWDKHEELAALVGISPGRAARARSFQQGLTAIAQDGDPSKELFFVDTDASGDHTEVWRFDPWQA